MAYVRFLIWSDTSPLPDVLVIRRYQRVIDPLPQPERTFRNRRMKHQPTEICLNGCQGYEQYLRKTANAVFHFQRRGPALS
jgi:hypothetical protein